MSRFVVNLTWEDAPHLSEKQKKELLASYSPHERDARSRGIPSLGSGAIYPVVLDEVVVPTSFFISDRWPRAAGMDVGWKKTACVWGAYDKKSDTIYCYSEYYKGYAEPSVHANGILARGRWIPIAIDCHADRRSEAGGKALLQTYSGLGLNVIKAKNQAGTLDSSILEVYQRLSSGRLKFCLNLHNTIEEFLVYRRDEDGRIVKENDHLMDALRYLVMSFTAIMETPPTEEIEDSEEYQAEQRARLNYRTGQSKITGY